jgi:hypothetical protein
MEKAFITYAELIKKRFQQENNKRNKNQPLQLHINPSIQIEDIGNKVESTSEFDELTRKTKAKFSEMHPEGSIEGWSSAVRNFFRRSGYYNQIFEGKSFENEKALGEFCQAFMSNKTQITYLGLMEYVRFDKQLMDFGHFQIRKFNRTELEKIFCNDINRAFYPYAAVNTEAFIDYWFICTNESEPFSVFGRKTIIDLDGFPKVKRQFSNFLPVIERIIQQITLFKWESIGWDETTLKDIHDKWHDRYSRMVGFRRFGVPFVVKVNHNLLLPPSRVPELPKLDTEPFINPAGEEIGEEPLILYPLWEIETISFEAFCLQAGQALFTLQSVWENIYYFELAMGYLVKAFFSTGLEQLLWHITALEALLGESGGGIQDKIANRLASILGKTENEKGEIKRKFKTIYDFRSDLVHGDEFDKEIYLNYLRYARSLARLTVTWFMNFLSYLTVQVRKGTITDFPSRKNILITLDQEPHNRNCLSEIFKVLPVEFPNIEKWTGNGTLVP